MQGGGKQLPCILVGKYLKYGEIWYIINKICEQKETSFFMEYIRKSLAFLLVLCLSLCLIPQAAFAEEAEQESVYQWITDREEVDGSNYTDIPALAEKLNSIFDGQAGVYYDSKCTQMVNTVLGSRRVPNNGVNQYVGPPDIYQNVGTSCWIYANGVYYTLFGEATGCGTAGENSTKLDLSGTSNKCATYENFLTWGVHSGVGALIRTRSGHSMIVLGYDAEKLTILDGNGDGKGLVSIRVRTWDRVSDTVKYIIQPNQSHMDTLYPAE